MGESPAFDGRLLDFSREEAPVPFITFGGRPTLCWNPAIQHDDNFGFTSGRFGFSIAGTTNIPVLVATCTNLASGVWTPLTNATLGSSGSIYVTDSSSTHYPVRFYRIVWP